MAEVYFFLAVNYHEKGQDNEAKARVCYVKAKLILKGYNSGEDEEWQKIASIEYNLAQIKKSALKFEAAL